VLTLEPVDDDDEGSWPEVRRGSVNRMMSRMPVTTSLKDLLRCPRCFSLVLKENNTHLQCAECQSCYPISAGRPVLLVPDHPLFPQRAYEDAAPETAVAHVSRLSASVNLSAASCLDDLALRLRESSETRVLLLGSGGQRAAIALRIAASVVAVDIDTRADVDVFADALALPFRDDCFDAVITTAVLEHVIRPELAMAEIVRVLKVGGLLYSEIPFMQQVHEGAYDFTRYTLSGHRRLAERFDELASGAVAGPGTALIWSVEHFLLALISEGEQARRVVKACVRTLLGWLKPIDRHISQRPAALDGASCTYFYGRLSRVAAVSDSEIVAGYRGAQRTRHA
jgi:SAM-dependent methyltransferase